MQRAVRHISAILGRVIFIGFSIQIVFGMTWMCLNFSKLPQFGESLFYVEISKNFICDEYTGILYPVFLLLARGIPKERIRGYGFAFCGKKVMIGTVRTV